MQRGALIAFLEVHGASWETWGRAPGEKSLDDLLKSIALGEVRLFSRPHPDLPGRKVVVQEKRAALIRIYLDAQTRRFTLVEYKEGYPAGGQRVFHPRLTNNGSLSETMRPGRNYMEETLRGFHEELGCTTLSMHEFLTWEHGFLSLPPESPRPSNKYPGTFSHVEREYGTCVMPQKSRHFRPQYIEKHEEKGEIKSIFRWWDMVEPLNSVSFSTEEGLNQFRPKEDLLAA